MNSNTSPNMAAMFLELSFHKLIKLYWPRLRGCVESLTDEQVWWRPNSSSNSIGNLVLHLNGNVGQWLVAAFDRSEDTRDRPTEFKHREMVSAAALLAQLGGTIEKASVILSRLTESDLLAMFEIQGYQVSGLEAVYQVVEHFGLHYGQILYVTKSLLNKDLGHYPELNNESCATE